MPRLLDAIDGPLDLKRLPLEQLPALCQEIREEIIATCAGAGGHLGSSLGAVELNVALHYTFDSPTDRLVWDVGHQAYGHKLLTGRRERFRTLRTDGGLAGFPERHESEHDAFGVGHASTGVSAALGMVEGKRHAGLPGRVVVLVGDGALTGGISFEGLNQTGELGRDLLVILNDNGMSISPNVGGLGRSLARGDGAGPRGYFEALGFSCEGPVDGHDVAGLIATLRAVIRRRGPVLLHVRTVKGRGYPAAESDAATRGHALSFFDVPTGKPLPRQAQPAFTDVFAEALCAAMERDPRVVAVTAAMLDGTGLARCKQRFPDRTYDVGIAEQHAVTFAAGLACEGLRPVVAIYSTFLQRAYDQVIHDVALQNLPVTFAVDRAGVVGADGKTHQGAFDLACLRCLPNVVLMAPSDELELQGMLATALSHEGPAVLRFPRRAALGLPAAPPAGPLEVGRARWLREPARPALLIAAVGTAAHAALQAADELGREGLEAAVLDARFVKPLDEETLCRAAASIRRVLTVEEGAQAGGFGSACLEAFERRGLLERGLRVKRLGFPDAFLPHGDPQKQLAALGLDAAGIARASRALAGARRDAPAVPPARATG